MEYSIYPFIILRTPSLPTNFEIDEDDLLKIANDPFFQEAIYLASPELFKKLSAEKGKNEKSIITPILKYYLRSSFRCTPFGLFAGTSVMQWGAETSCKLNNMFRENRLDAFLLCELSKILLNTPKIRQNIKFYPNNSIYKIDKEYRYNEYKNVFDKRTYTLTKLQNSTALKRILDKATSGLTLVQLSEILDSEKYTKTIIDNFLNDLVENQVLVSELEFNVTGEEYFERLLKVISLINKDNIYDPLIKNIEKINKLIIKLDNYSPGKNLLVYEEIKGIIETNKIPFKENKLFHVNLFKNLESDQLSSKIQNKLNYGFKALCKLTPINKNIDLNHFINRFYERYEEREVTLLEALDPEYGIGYPHNKEGDETPLSIGFNSNKSAEKEVTLENINKWLLEKLQRANLFNEYIVQISDEELQHLPDHHTSYPPSFSVVFKVVDFNDQKIFIESASHSSAINLLGRFAHGNNKINNICQDIAQQEQDLNSDVLYAEIVHVSENRDVNFLMHPTFRSYEIPFLSVPGVQAANQIYLNDLLISIKDDYVVLRSKRLNKEIIPRLSNAHNYELSELPVYRFLCDLQTQIHYNGLSFFWGPTAEYFNFLPRVEYKNTILHLATWQLNKTDWQYFLISDKQNFQKSISEFRKKWKLPQYIVLADYDNELFIDFNNILIVKVWLQTIKNRDKIILKEFLFDPNTPIQDEKGHMYMNEFIASFIKTKSSFHGMISEFKNNNKIVRSFSPGSEWIYLKYYCSIKAADKVLKDVIAPFINALIKNKMIDKWFFVRFADPDNHIRLRLHLNHADHLQLVLLMNRQFIKSFEETNLVFRIQLDSYTREIERYTIEAMEDSEELFFHDSSCVINFILQTSNHIKSKYFWLWAIKGIDELLNDFGFKLEDKKMLLKELKEAFYREFQIEKFSKLQIDAKYRKYSADIENVINGKFYENFQELPFNLFKIRSKKLKKTIKNISLNKKANLQNNLIKSYIHMFINRTFTHSQRKQEMVLYDFLFRFYLSLEIRKRIDHNH